MLLFPNLTVYLVDGAEESISTYYCVWRLTITALFKHTSCEIIQ